MAKPLQLLPVTSFLGTYEGVNQVVGLDIFSPSGSENMYIDRLGRARKIPGYTEATASPLTTDTGGSAAAIRGLFFYTDFAPGTTIREIIAVLDDGVNEYEIWKSSNDGVTWSFLSDISAASSGKIPNFAQLGQEVYITNGVVAPRKYDGTSVTVAGATQSPTITPAANGAGLLDGSYRWKLVSVESDGTRAAGSPASDTLQLAEGQATLSWTADPNGDVTGYEIYRTTGTGSTYWFVGYVDGRLTVAYDDNADDDTILANRALQEHGDPPPVGAYYCEPFKERMWWLATDVFPDRGWFSDPALPWSVGSNNYLNFQDSENAGDGIKGAIGNYQGMFVVFKERSIWTVSGTGALVGGIIDYYRRKTNAQTGTVSDRTIVRVPAGAQWRTASGVVTSTNKPTLAYLTPAKDIRLFDGDGDTVISQSVKDSLATLNDAQRGQCHALHNPEEGQITWFYPDGASTTPDRAVTWNYRYGVWYRWGDYSGVVSAVTAESTTGSQLLLIGDTAGDVHTFWSGATFNGATFDAKWMTGTMVGTRGESQEEGMISNIPALAYTKRWRWLDLLIETNASVSLVVEWFRGHADDEASAVGSVTFSPDDTTRNTTQKKLLLKTAQDYFHDQGLRLRVSNQAGSGQWAVEGFTLAFQVMEGLRRRSQ